MNDHDPDVVFVSPAVGLGMLALMIVMVTAVVVLIMKALHIDVSLGQALGACLGIAALTGLLSFVRPA